MPQFLSRPRLRTDGVYWQQQTSITYGVNEGRGMKEEGRNFYRGKVVTARYWRYFRFFPDGRFHTVTTWRTPAVVARGMSRADTRSLRQVGAVLRGSYEVVRDNAVASVRLRAAADVVLDEYPDMHPGTVHFEFCLLGLGEDVRAATNAALVLDAHYSAFADDGSDTVDHPVPAAGEFNFCSFDAARRGVGTASGVDALAANAELAQAGEPR